MGISKALTDVALAAQRVRRLDPYVPAFARRRVGSITAALMNPSADELVDDWSRPLLPGGIASELSMPAAAAGGVTLADARRPGTRAAADAPRCLLATSSLDVGGMDEVVAFLALGLREHGLRTAVLHTGPGASGRLAQVLASAGIEVVIAAEDDARGWIRRWAPHVISAHEASSWVLEEARQMGIPYVEVMHGMHSLFDCDWQAEARRSRNITSIIAVSELVRIQYLRAVPTFPGTRIVTIPNGVDDQRRSRVDRSAARAALGLRDEFLFVSLARQCLQKNVYGLITAFDEVAARHPEAHLLVAGRVDTPAYCKQVRRAWERLAARDRVHLRDHAADPGLVLSAADGFVLDSFFEGWPLATMEALYAGVPVVASDVGGTREQIGEAGSRGYLIDNPLGDPLEVNWETLRSVCYARQANRDQLVEAMSALVRERDQWSARREELAAESASRFDPEHCLRAHAALLHACVADRGDPYEQAA